MTRLKFISLIGICSLFFSCGEEAELVSEETREITTLDQRPVLLEPTSKDRFAPPGVGGANQLEEPITSGFTFITPTGWEEKEATMFRSVNMSLPEGGEAYLSEVGGNLLDNVNRWYGQFGLEKVTLEVLTAGEQITLAGEKAYLVTASGNYNAGMGRAAKNNVTLLGAIAESKGGLLTVKLIAPYQVAEKELPAFKKFCASLNRK